MYCVHTQSFLNPTVNNLSTPLANIFFPECLLILHTLLLIASMDMHVEQGSIGDVLDETEWDVAPDNAVVSIQTNMALKKVLLQTESEIRYMLYISRVRPAKACVGRGGGGGGGGLCVHM